jgi:hypothetical protein
MTPWRLIAAPFLLGSFYFFYKFFDDHSYAYYLTGCVVILAALYVLSPQVNWFFYKRRPPKLPEPIVRLFIQNIPFFRNLSNDNKKKFCDRVSLYMIASDFMPKVFEKVPEDVKAAAAACAVRVSFGKPDFLFPNFEHIIVYPKSFPSPQYPRNIHPSEIYDHDGVIMFSAEHLMHGIIQPQRFFNVGMHEYAKVFMESYPTEDWPELDESYWPKLEQVSGFGKEAIFKYMNLDDITPLAVSIVFFFDFPQKFKAVLPELYGQYATIFNVLT